MALRGTKILAMTVIALAALASGAEAKPGYRIQGPEDQVGFGVRASNGYFLEVAATRHRRGPGRIEVFLFGPDSSSVEYKVNGTMKKDGSVAADLPGVGRIAVRFEPTKVQVGSVADGCRGPRSVAEQGYFRGTIRLRGEGGFTEVHRTRVSGTVFHSFRMVCRQPRLPRHPGQSSRGMLTGVVAGRNEGGRHLFFYGVEGEIADRRFGPSFTVSSSSRREGMTVTSSATVAGKRSNLVVSEAEGAKVGKLTPPAPFEGSATLRLAGANSSTWEGDLAVELPGLGRIPLAGPGFWSGLCEETCKGTLPPGKNVFFFAIGSGSS